MIPRIFREAIGLQGGGPKTFKERINYTIDGKYYVGYPVNLPFILCQAESLEELEKKIKILTKYALEEMIKSFNAGEVELVEISKTEWRNQP